TGAIFLIIANPPTSLNWGVINAWENAVTPIQGQLLFPFDLTIGLMALTVAFVVGYSLTSREVMVAALAGILSLLDFFMTAFPIVDIEEVTVGEVLQYLGGQGLFVAIILSIIATELMRFLINKGFAFEMPAGVPPYVL